MGRWTSAAAVPLLVQVCIPPSVFADATIAGVPPTHVFKPKKGAAGFAFSPDSQRLAVRTGEGEIVLRDVATGAVVAPPFKPGHKKQGWRSKFKDFLPSHRFGWSSDGRRLVALGADKVTVWDASTGDIVLRREDLEAATASPDGSLVALQSRGEVVLWDVAAGAARSQPTAGDLGDFSPDGRFVVVVVRNALLLVPVAGGPAASVPLSDAGGIYAWAFSPDGGMLAVVEKRGTDTTLWDLKGAQPSKLPSLSWAMLPSFSSDGKLFATSIPGRVGLWDVAGLTTEPRLIDLPHNEWTKDYAVRFSFWPGAPLMALTYRKGGSLSDKNYSVEVWDVGERKPRMLDRIPRAIQFGFDRSGAMLAYKWVGLGVGLWDARERRTVRLLLGDCASTDPLYPERAAYPAFSDDGSWFACASWPTLAEVAVWKIGTRD
jgi:WD40 repeat protein